MNDTELLERLKKRQVWLATVESCTGGLIAHHVTRIAGASEIFWGGWVTYDNSAKVLLQVPHEMITRHGAVSPETAHAMAEGGLAIMMRALESKAKDRLLACVSTTGVAGPSGGSVQKPVGLCYVGVAIAGLPSSVHEIRETEGLAREEYQRRFTQTALDQLLNKIESN